MFWRALAVSVTVLGAMASTARCRHHELRRGLAVRARQPARRPPILRAPTSTPPIPATTTRRGGSSTSRTTGASSCGPTPTRRHDGRHRLLPGRPRLVPQDVHAAALAARQADLASSSTASTWTPRSTSTAARSRAIAYGYTGFEVDLTASRTPTAARRTSSRSRCATRCPSSRWYSGSGIYRHVHLVVTDPRPRRAPRRVRHHAGLSSDLRRGYARVHVRTTDGRRRPRARASRPCATPRGRRRRARRAAPRPTSACAHPQLWSTEHPNLYTLRRPARARRPRCRPHDDHVRHPLVRVRPRTRGFSLNGRRMKLQGVDLHHDEGALGAAIN